MLTLDASAFPSLLIDVPLRALFFNFQASVHDAPSAEGKVSKSKSLFRQKIAFHQLGDIWETYSSTARELSFLVILDSPAIFHRRLKDITKTFSGDRSWREPDTWWRQTELAHDPGLQKGLPTNLCKKGQMLDLGKSIP